MSTPKGTLVAVLASVVLGFAPVRSIPDCDAAWAVWSEARTEADVATVILGVAGVSASAAQQEEAEAEYQRAALRAGQAELALRTCLFNQ